MEPTRSKKRREKLKAAASKSRGETPAKPRLGGPRLTRIERNKLRAGCLRRIGPGDTIGKLAERLGQSQACIREALSHDIRCVDELLDGGKCSEIAKVRPEWSPEFVDLARRDIFARRDWVEAQRWSRRNSYDTQGQPCGRTEVKKPWADFNRGQTTRRRAAKQVKKDRFKAQEGQLSRMQEIEQKAAFARFCSDEYTRELSMDDLSTLCMDIEL